MLGPELPCSVPSCPSSPRRRSPHTAPAHRAVWDRASRTLPDTRSDCHLNPTRSSPSRFSPRSFISHSISIFKVFLPLPHLSRHKSMATETLAPIDRIQKTFEDLESERTLINACSRQWKTLNDHFASLSQTLADRSQTLESKIQTLDSQTEQTLNSLNLREAVIPDRESTVSASIESKKESFIKVMEDSESKAPSTNGDFLRLYCRRMDSSNLWKFMIAHRKDLAMSRDEVTDAIVESLDSCQLVIDAVDDFLNQGESFESGVVDRCWAIGMMLRALFDSEGRKGPEVSEKIRVRAAEVAAEWRKRIGGKRDGENGEMGSGEVQIFLQMVVAFGLKSKFDEEELRKLVVEHPSRKEMAKLAAGLGFGTKMVDIIKELVKAGKELEAVCYACESGLTKKFPPASLLKNHLNSLKKKVQGILKNGNNSAAAIEEACNLELNALRSIIKCVEYYKLESKFSIGGLKKRLANMEKAKVERRKIAFATKSQNKRVRASKNFRPSKAARTNNTAAQMTYNYPIQGGGYMQSPSTSMIHPQYYGGASINYSGYDYAAPPDTAPLPHYPH